MTKKREKKNFITNSVSTRPWQENSKKKNIKKIQKIRKPLSIIIFSQSGMGQAKNKSKKFQSRIPFILDPDKKIPKKIAKKLKKHLSSFDFSQNRMRQAEKGNKKFQSRIPLILNLGKKIPKNTVKKVKKLKYLFPTLFLAKTG